MCPSVHNGEMALEMALKTARRHPGAVTQMMAKAARTGKALRQP